MVYDPTQHKRVVSIENINLVLANVDKTKAELNELQDQRKDIGKEISRVRRIGVVQ